MSYNTLVLAYNSFGDPLFQNVMLSYLKTLAENDIADFHLITFEQPQYSIGPGEKEVITTQLKKLRIFWHPLTFHTGNFILVKKLWDLSQLMYKAILLKFKHRIDTIFCFANIAGSFGFFLSKILSIRLIIYSYEPHSEFLVDLGQWQKESLKFKLLNAIEWRAGLEADVILTGTKWMVDELKARKTKAEVFRAPTSVDEKLFVYSGHDRDSLRRRYGLKENEVVFLYVGKFGGLYYQEEIAVLFHEIQKTLSKARFLVVTSNDHENVREMLGRYLNSDQFIITGNLSFKELISHLSAADIGISGVPPSPSQKFRSPTKVAEYMMMGLPYITTKGVAEDDIYAEDHNVGIVLEDFGSQLSDEFFMKLESLLGENDIHLRARIRQVGLEYRSKEKIDRILLECFS